MPEAPIEPIPGEAPLTLLTVAGGSAVELFQQELDKVLENILDPNTHATAKRQVSLTVTIVPSDDARNTVGVAVECVSKLAPFKGSGGVAFVGRSRAGRAVAVAHNPRQGALPFDSPTAIPIQSQKTGTGG